MYIIDSKIDKPDIDYLFNQINDSMKRGIKLGDIDELYTKLLNIQTQYKNIIQDNYGIENPNSSKQVIDYLKTLMSVEVTDICVVDGKWTTNKNAMYNLALSGYQIASDILNYRKAKKYAESIKSFKDAMNPITGMIHPEVSLSKTNRINYRNPALMNIPKELLWIMINPREDGNILFSADIKNQEPTILINWLNIEELKSALIPNQDNSSYGLYEALFEKPFRPAVKLNLFISGLKEDTLRVVPSAEMANSESIPPVYYSPVKPIVSSTYYLDDRKVKLIQPLNMVIPVNYSDEIKFPSEAIIQLEDGERIKVGVEWESLDRKLITKTGIQTITGYLKDLHVKCEGIERSEFKTAWNAMTYGASIMGVRATCKHIDGDTVYKYFSKIPEFAAYRKQCDTAARKGYQLVKTYFKSELIAGEENPSRLKRVLMDLPIQGTASDILSLLIKHLNSEIDKRGLTGKIELYYSRHDELIIEVKKEYYDEVGSLKVREELKDILEHRIDDWTPFRLEIDEVKKTSLQEIISRFNDEEE